MISTRNDYKVLCCIITLLLVFMFFAGPASAPAKAVATEVALISIVIAGLAALGITFVSTGAYSTLNDYVGSLMGQYATYRGVTFNELTRGCNAGANTVGQLLLNNKFVDVLGGFAQWIKDTFQLTDNTTITVISPGTVVNDLTMYSLPIAWNSGFYNYEWTIVTSTAPVLCLFGTASSTLTIDNAKAWFFSEEAATIHRRSWNQYGTSERDYTLQYSATLYAYPYYSYAGGELGSDGNYVAYLYDEWYPKLAHGNDIEESTSGTQVDIRTGAINLPADDPNYATGDGAVVDLQLPWGVTYPDIVDNWIPAEWTNSQAGKPSIAYDPPAAIAGQVTSTAQTPSVSDDPDEYQTPGLQNVFPFCIPFDIYNLLSAFAADPVAPAFNWRFYVPGIVDEQISIDLSPFDTAAQVLRTVELLAFIVGLAMVTRERFLRG